MKSIVTIGRSSNCDIIIPDEIISREHARIKIVGGQYVYENIGKNGSVIGGRIIHGEKVSIAAGTEILLAGKIPLPWSQIYAMLPLQGVKPFENNTKYNHNSNNQEIANNRVDNIGIGWGILAFIIPLAGWIMYFCWKDTRPIKASQANIIACISFALNIISMFSYL
jgi:pSer/pThr/pTyr-binding forkhead associated (FHA) protein